MPNHQPTHKHTGAIYTPTWIVDLMLSTINVPTQPTPIHILDPSCGDGAFLVRIAQQWIEFAHKQQMSEIDAQQHIVPYIHGYDIDPNAIQALRLRLDALTTEHGWQSWAWDIHVANALDPTHRAHIAQRMDIVVGNPPYIRIHNLPTEQREIIRQLPSCRKGMTDLYIAFYDLGLEALTPHGRMAYITPNSWFHSQAGTALRHRFATEQRLSLVQDLHDIQPFDGVTTYTSIQYLGPIYSAPTYTYNKYNPTTQTFDTITTQPSPQLEHPQWNQPPTTATTHTSTLSDHVRISVGLATLADKVFFVHPNPNTNPSDTPQNTIAVIGIHGPTYIEENILRRCIKASTWDGQSFDRYALFPYDDTTERPTIIPETTLAETYPHAYRYLQSCKDILDQRDKGKPNPVAWYAYGRTQGLTTARGPSLITSPINTQPNFLVLDDPTAYVMSGYILAWTDRPNTPENLQYLQSLLNTNAMAHWVSNAGGGFKNGWHSYRKNAIKHFPFSP